MKTINNEFYHDLGDRWHTAKDHPIALLRAENRLRNPWIASHLKAGSKILDMGCGAGFLTHDLARLGHHVLGIDISAQSLEVAQRLDPTQQVHYLRADVTAIPSPSASFDVVCAMDLLEHVEDPAAVVKEAARLLKPGGLFFFHTFNRTPLSWLLVIKGVELALRNVPPAMHIYRLFVKPSELTDICTAHELTVQEIRGVNLKFAPASLWRMIRTREVPDDLEFVFTKSLAMGYSGLARKN